ncbi:hypothetical protein BAU15_01905 [Enterococcus sp. JM4C]|uniref:glycosyl hydrolase n=1 Tax=Candidatus Enterococcus huntleyi TaxID=1857217 RepID=UPI00137ABE53|nr:glycosyl hydrolase [Enterococcus sp. JM4C]KAF1299423.1 hypothetical protein BAU15_01905 [Enterococcus sp. JM4C]
MTHTIEDILKNEYDNHMLPFFWQKSAEKEETIVEYIQKMYESDIRAFCIESRPFEGFCEGPWWDRVSLIIKEAKKRDMKIWILDDIHFPTGLANNKVKNYPGLNKKVLKHHVVNVVGPCNNLSLSINQPFPVESSSEFLGAVAVSQKESRILPNELIDGYLYFDLPEGRWDIYVLNISSETDVAPDYINMMSKESCEILIKEVYEKHYEQFADEFGQTIVGFFSDEPGFQNERGVKSDSLIGKNMPLPWSPEVLEKLMALYGGNYLEKLPHLWTMINEETPKIRKQFMDVVTELYQENFSNALGNWCRAHQVKYIGHIIEDRESHARLGVGAGHFYRSMIGQDMAGSDIISNQLIPGLDSGLHSWARGVWDGEFFHYALGKMTSSLARIDAKKQGNSMTEVFGAYGWHEGVKLMKWILDHLLVRGINNFVPHAFSPAPFPDDDCPPHFYGHGQNPQFRYFKQLMTYTNKMATLLSDGQVNAEVAVIYHAESEWTGDYMSSQKPARALTQQQVEFDIIPNDVFKQENDYAVVADKKLTINGNDYSVIVVPYSEYIDDDLYQFISRSEETTVIFIGGYPKATMEQRVYVDQARLKEKSQLMSLPEFEDYLTEAGLSEYQLEEKLPYLRAIHYQKDSEDYYMFFNEHPHDELAATINFSQFEKPYRLDVLNNRVTAITENKLTLAAYESCVVFDGVGKEDYLVAEQTYNMKKVLDEKATISFAKAIDYPVFSQETAIDKLVDITKYIDSSFAGTIRYEFNFQLEEALDTAKIQLNGVYEVAEVTLNGENLGARICPPYEFFECQLSKGHNQLVIDITNTLDKEVFEKHSAAQVRQPSGLLEPVIICY